MVAALVVGHDLQPHLVGGDPVGGTQHGDGEAFVELAAVHLQQRHAAEDAILVHQWIVEEAAPAGGLDQFRQVAGIALGAGHAEALEGGLVELAQRRGQAANLARLVALHPGAEDVAQHHCAPLHALGEAAVGVQLWRQLAPGGLEGRVVAQAVAGQLAQQAAGRGIEGLGEGDVEADHAHAIVVEQPIEDARQHIAPPGPVAEFRQAVFVDVGDDDAPIHRAGRGEIELQVVDQVVELLQQRQAEVAAHMEQEQGNEQGAEEVAQAVPQQAAGIQAGGLQIHGPAGP